MGYLHTVPGYGASPSLVGNVPDNTAPPEPKVIDSCLDGAYDGQDAIILTYDDGSIKYCLKSGGALTDATDKSKIECSPAPQREKEYFEIVRLAWDASEEWATPHKPAVPATGMAAMTMVAGRKFKLTGAYDSVTPVFLRATDPNAIVCLNEVGYRAGADCTYPTMLPAISSANNEEFCQEICFEAKEGAYIEILITRTVPTT